MYEYVLKPVSFVWKSSLIDILKVVVVIPLTTALRTTGDSDNDHESTDDDYGDDDENEVAKPQFLCKDYKAGIVKKCYTL